MTNCFPHDEIAAQHQLSGQKLGISSNTSRNIPDWRKRRCPVLREGNLFLKTRPREPAIGQMHANFFPQTALAGDPVEITYQQQTEQHFGINRGATGRTGVPRAPLLRTRGDSHCKQISTSADFSTLPFAIAADSPKLLKRLRYRCKVCAGNKNAISAGIQERNEPLIHGAQERTRTSKELKEIPFLDAA